MWGFPLLICISTVSEKRTLRFLFRVIRSAGLSFASRFCAKRWILSPGIGRSCDVLRRIYGQPILRIRIGGAPVLR
jgi:hypothetical protein